MESLIETFHVDIKLLIAQAINFAIVFFVLYFFALKPLFKVMRERTEKIEKSMEDAKKVEEKLALAEVEYKAEVSRAKKDAYDILEKAKIAAEEKKKEIVARAKEDVGDIINKERAKMQVEKGKVLREIKKEIGDLVAASLEKILGEKVDNKKDTEIIKKLIK